MKCINTHKKVVLYMQETNYSDTGNFGKSYIGNIAYQILL